MSNPYAEQIAQLEKDIRDLAKREGDLIIQAQKTGDQKLLDAAIQLSVLRKETEKLQLRLIQLGGGAK